MASLERSKKKAQLWKKAIVHFLLCFLMGFFTGFTPMRKSSVFSHHALASSQPEISPKPLQVLHRPETQSGNNNRSLLNETPVAAPPNDSKPAKFLKKVKQEPEPIPRRLVIIVSPTSAKDHLRGVLLRRLANTLKLAPPPLLWVVVEAHSESSEVSEILRKTGVMYRHLVFKENFTDLQVEMDHQKNVALNHIEHHRLSGIVHFAGLSNVYDLSLFDEIRSIEAFGTWPVALLSANRKRVIIEGPVCDSSDVIGWHLRQRNNLKNTPSPVHISSFAFNSSILWDPERWGRPSSVQDSSQNAIKYVKEEVMEEETKLKGMPAKGCSKVMLWRLRSPKETS